MVVNERFNLKPRIPTAAETAAVEIENLTKTFVLEQIPAKRGLVKKSLPVNVNTLVLETNEKQAYTANIYTNYEGLRFYLKVESNVNFKIENNEKVYLVYYVNLITERVMGVDIPPESRVLIKPADNIALSGIFLALELAYYPFSIEVD